MNMLRVLINMSNKHLFNARTHTYTQKTIYAKKKNNPLGIWPIKIGFAHKQPIWPKRYLAYKN